MFIVLLWPYLVFIAHHLGSAAGVGFPAAMLDVMDIEDESPQELLARAEREGLDLRVFATGDDTDDGW